jgi:cellulose synthase/poly-beta-1,6-N-acetylglucosamine synthase-like glycosyltransferase
MEWIVSGVYLGSLFLLFVYSLHQARLAWVVRNHRQKSPLEPSLPAQLPRVTVQLPIYNEQHVVERLLRAAHGLDWPRELLQVQVLDDSTDETSRIVRHVLDEIDPNRKVFHHVQRSSREGFKAGALQYGLSRAQGEFIAIFDADFLPHPDFLKKTIPHFENTEVGMVQTRWGHINKEFDVITRLQAFGLDAHFTVEQVGRNVQGCFINFNGTAGVWRKRCIEAAGGWSADTLTEDLDLSYRAQLKGWKFSYCLHVVAPAELPVVMSAVKSQQYRWNKGGAETARKHLWNVGKSGFPLATRLQGMVHLLNSSVFLLVLISALASVPMLYVKHTHPQFAYIFHLGSLFLLGFFSIGFFYFVSASAISPTSRWRYFLKNFPQFLVFSMGLSLHNSIAVVEGWVGRKTPFIRTPKFNVGVKSKELRDSPYLISAHPPSTWIEALLAVFFMGAIAYGIHLKDLGLVLFHGLLAAGFGLVFFHTLNPPTRA